jgi:superfamily II DNA or RNA helicase
VNAEFAVGARVSARGLAWDVLEVAPLGAQTLLRLRCAGGDLNGLEWELLHPAEPVALLRADLRPDAPGSLAGWRLYHQACLLEQVLGPDDVLLATPGRVRIEPYQLVPLMRALELPRPRLLLADGVGLGKTIEAGLIACELIARRRAHRVLVVSPAGPLLVQWAQELRERFGLRLTAITDANALQQQRRRLELGGNPFDAIALCLVSLDFAKQERVLEELERSAWDLAIIDEAHHCIGSASVDREETQRRRLAEVIAQRSDGLLLLTATPHDGYDPHFASLIELLDPSLVDGHGGLAGTAYRRHVVRRLKSHIRDPSTGAPMFRERRVEPIRVEIAAAPVRRFHQALATLIAPRLRRAARQREFTDALAFISLLKRSVSTISACVNTLRVVAERYSCPEEETNASRRERARSLRAYRKRLLRFDVLDATDEGELAELEADGMAAAPQKFAASAGVMERLICLGEAAAQSDPKLETIVREVHAIRAEHPGANILIYTEYADSQVAAVQALRNVNTGEVLAINGLDNERERSRVAQSCAERDNIVLISTDSLAEGLNLQERCCHLIHLDLPYNPNRLEQRNGRIDRYGQRHDPQIRYLYLAGTFEERLLLRLISKYEQARAHLDVMPDTLAVSANEDDLDAALVSGFAEKQAGLFDDEPSSIRTIDRAAEDANADAYRDLLREIDRAFDGFERSAVRHGWLDGLATVDAMDRHTSRCLPHIDLPNFIAEAIQAETGHPGIDHHRLLLPTDWCAGLEGLPGFDRERSTLRFTRNRSRYNDPQGRSLAYLGRAHPVLRQACARAHCLHDGGYDNRIAVAVSDGNVPAVLLTFSLEQRSALRCELRRVVAVLLPAHGPAKEVAEAGQWLQLAEVDWLESPDTAWNDLFEGWVPRRQSEAMATAECVMRRELERLQAVLQHGHDREASQLQAWLRMRTDDICGPYHPRTGDLFGGAATIPDWQFLDAPLDRLAAFAADSDNTPMRRREASNAVALFRQRSEIVAARTALSAPALTPIGMLMLVPRTLAE